MTKDRSSGADQAAGLRALMSRQTARLITVVEPNEGVGGENDVDVGLGTFLARAHARRQPGVLLIHESQPAQAIWLTRGGERVILPARPNVPFNALGEVLSAYACEAHVVVVAARTRSHGGLSRLAASAHEVVVAVRGNDPSGAALTSAYACVKQLHQRHALMRLRVLVTECESADHGRALFSRLEAVASRYLAVSLEFVGTLSGDAQSGAGDWRGLAGGQLGP